MRNARYFPRPNKTALERTGSIARILKPPFCRRRYVRHTRLSSRPLREPIISRRLSLSKPARPFARGKEVWMEKSLVGSRARRDTETDGGFVQVRGARA